MNFFTDEKENQIFLRENLMGPNCVRLLGELLEKVPLNKDMRILDLGCGKGLSSMALAQKTGAQIFAADLWIDPSENYERFLKLGFDKQIIPLKAEAHDLPFAQNYFDAVISIDSYHYYGATEEYLDKNITPLIKKDGIIAIAVPGMQKEPLAPPKELKPYWVDDMNFHSVQWWKELWQKSPKVENVDAYELKTHAQAWQDWLECDNPYAKKDAGMMETEGGKYFNTVAVTAKVK